MGEYDLTAVLAAVDKTSGAFASASASVDGLVSKYERIGEISASASAQTNQYCSANTKSMLELKEVTASAGDSLKTASASAENWTGKVDGMEKSLLQAATSTEGLMEAGHQAASALTVQETAIESASQSSESYRDSMGRLRDSNGRFISGVKESEEGLSGLGEGFEDTGQKSEEFGKKSKAAVEGLGQVLVAAGAVALLTSMATAFMDCSAAAATFETAGAQIQTVADTSQLSMGEINGTVLDLSNDMGQAATELSAATYQAISASVDTADAVQFTADATKLAVGGFTQSATAVDVLTTALNSYGLESTESIKISDMLITTQNLGKTTVNELASNMGRVIPLAAAYNVEMDNLSASYAVMTANGIATAESTTYIKSMLGELGDSASAVSVALREETGQSFSQLMQNGSSLGDVLQTLGSHVNGDVTAFNQLWSSAEAGIGALSIFNSGADKFNSVLGEMQNSAGATEKAYRTMSDTTEYAQKRMETSFTNLKIVIGEQFNPTVKAAYNGIAGLVGGMASFVQENPEVVAAITGTLAATVATTAAIGLYTAGTHAAATATTLFSKALKFVSGHPIVAIVAGITGLVAGISAMCSTMGEAEEEYRSLTAVSKQNYDAVQDATGKYQEACAAFGEASPEARALKAEVDYLTESFEANKQTTEEMNQKLKESADAHAEMLSKISESREQMEQEGASVEFLVDRLATLTSKPIKTASDSLGIESIVDSLNEKIPSLELKYDSMTGSANKSFAVIKASAKEYADYLEAEHNKEALGQLFFKQSSLEKERKSAQEEFDASLRQYQEYKAIIEEMRATGITEGSDIDYQDFLLSKDRLSEAQVALDSNRKLIDDNRTALSDLEDSLGNIAEAQGEFGSEADRGFSAAIQVTESYREQIDKLQESYNMAYESALTSIQGQYSLWEKADEVTAMSAGDINSALESQISHWQDYNSNLQSLGERSSEIDGLNEMLASFADGSTESVSAIAGMASASDTELSAMVSNWQTLQTEQDNASVSIGKTAADFDAKLSEMQAQMNQTVAEMQMSEEASAAASSTINAYVAAIQAGVGPASTAASAVANAVSSILGKISFNVPNVASAGNMEKNAKGTASAKENIFLAGEEGPELIVGQKGATVFTHEETVNILRSMSAPESGEELSVDSPWIAPQQAESLPVPQAYLPTPSSVEKTLHINLEGSGKIRVEGGGFTKSQMSQVLLEQLEPLLMRLLEDEMEEEGEFSYAF